MKKSEEKPELVVIGGPTAVGKTSLAIELAKEFNAEIINADSRQIYRKLNIGTAKPTNEEQAKVPHHLIDLVDPDEYFSAARFAELGQAKIEELQKERKNIFIVGGTGLYIKALIYGLFPIPQVNPEFKEELREEADKKGIGRLYEKLKHLDPKAARRIHPNDRQRILRALEVITATGKSIVEYQEAHKFRERRYETLKIALYRPRKELYERINKRVLDMVSVGLVEEIRELLEGGYTPELSSMTSLGYQYIASYLKGEISLKRAIELLQRDTRRYAKRQLTWFRGDKEFMWYRPEEKNRIRRLIQAFYANRERKRRP